MSRDEPRGGGPETATAGAPAPGTEPATATWAYCVLRASAPPDPAAAPPGPPGASAPHALDLGPGLWLLAAAVPLPEYSAAEIERRLGDLEWVSGRALAHEAVVEHFAAAGPVVPLPLFTLFADDQRARRRLAGQRPRLERALERVEGCAEWGLKVFLEPETAAPPPEPALSGTEFLARKRDARAAARGLAERARTAAAELYEALAAAAAAAVEKPPPEVSGVRLLLEAAFLVREEDAAAFEREVASRAAGLRAAGCSVTLTGPWPPYHFVGEDLG